MPHRCGSTDTGGDEPCQRQIADDRDREHCWEHANPGESVSGAPSESLEGNQNAAGNAGGGAPELNANAAKHHGWADPLKHYERLEAVRPPAAVPLTPFVVEHTEMDEDEDAFEWVNHRVEGYVEHYALVHDMDREEVEADDELMDRLRALGAMFDQEWRAALEMLANFEVEREAEYELADGDVVTCTTETINPAWRGEIRLSQRRRSERKALGIDPRTVREARREREQAEQWQQALEEADPSPAEQDRRRVGLEGDAAVAAITQPLDAAPAPGPNAEPGETPANSSGAVATDGGSIEDSDADPDVDADAAETDEHDGTDEDTGFRLRSVGGRVA